MKEVSAKIRFTKNRDNNNENNHIRITMTIITAIRKMIVIVTFVFFSICLFIIVT